MYKKALAKLLSCQSKPIVLFVCFAFFFAVLVTVAGVVA